MLRRATCAQRHVSVLVPAKKAWAGGRAALAVTHTELCHGAGGGLREKARRRVSAQAERKHTRASSSQRECVARIGPRPQNLGEDNKNAFPGVIEFWGLASDEQASCGLARTCHGAPAGAVCRGLVVAASPHHSRLASGTPVGISWPSSAAGWGRRGGAGRACVVPPSPRSRVRRQKERSRSPLPMLQGRALLPF